jgi:hypothetical protein
LALAVPLSRFTSRVGGGSAFFVRHLDHATMTPEQEDKITKAIGDQAAAFNKFGSLIAKLDKSINRLNKTLEDGANPPETPPNWKAKKPKKPTAYLDLGQPPDA